MIDVLFALFADDFDEYALATPAVEFSVENLFPGTEIETGIRNGNDNFSAHDLPFQMRVGIILAGPVVLILRRRLVGSQ